MAHQQGLPSCFARRYGVKLDPPTISLEYEDLDGKRRIRSVSARPQAVRAQDSRVQRGKGTRRATSVVRAGQVDETQQGHRRRQTDPQGDLLTSPSFISLHRAPEDATESSSAVYEAQLTPVRTHSVLLLPFCRSFAAFHADLTQRQSSMSR